MLRFLEVAMQVRGQAGEHQVDGAKLALGQAYGGGLAVLRHVGGRERQALTAGHTGVARHRKSETSNTFLEVFATVGSWPNGTS